ncbi:DUF2254 domain-containing protein [Lacimicrobium alkaliphilum]|uniref:DUF2254 domain-containing protein n=1 Tax=Lacimicrobium alkaliphilum TaxID=1526571 RepID=A0ABQ1R1F6_9ALTE|nr:DUF2254 domain-containing protein [Lacimicrobium alkaliphilum]GGD54795.1 hypothetical protein GCM10011357_08140 [Lacimicrobium alkaliphilum]
MPFISADKIRFLLQQLSKQLWLKPLVISVLSVLVAFLAKLAEGTSLAEWVPEVTFESVSRLLSVMSSSMMVIATLAVASMVSAYASASSTATPRAVKLVIADDLSQNALSTFIGAFIFSIVALTAIENDFYEDAGLFTLLVLTVLVFAIVILTFVRWVDRIARLGRVGTTIDSVEDIATQALCRRRRAPDLGGVPATDKTEKGSPLYCDQVGYVQHIDMARLQQCAEDWQIGIRLAVLPGTFVTPDRPLAWISGPGEQPDKQQREQLCRAFMLGKSRTFEDDPRFALVVLAEIASRALSPAVNDPGTGIDIIGRMVRLFVLWGKTEIKPESSEGKNQVAEIRYDRIEVPPISVDDMFDDAFTPIARDGAANVEVSIRLQKALRALSKSKDTASREAAVKYAALALKRSEHALTHEQDIIRVRQAMRD